MKIDWTDLKCKETYPQAITPSTKKKPVWLLLDEKIKNFASFLGINPKHLFIAGGAITSLLNGETPRDYDFWLSDVEVAKTAVEEIANKHSRWSDKIQIDFITNPDGYGCANIQPLALYRAQTNVSNLCSESGGSIYYSDGDIKISEYAFTATLNGETFQLILKQIDKPQNIISKFDFQHCHAYFSVTEGLVVPPKTQLSISTKQLKYVGQNNAFISLLRMKKFIDRGWKIDRMNAINIVLNYLASTETDKDQLNSEIVSMADGIVLDLDI